MVVGNVVEDQAPGGGWAPGGPSLYSARTALALGARVTLVTALPPAYDASVLEGLDVRALPAAGAPRYSNAYDAAGARTQLLLAEGEPLPIGAASAAAAGCDALLLAPAFHELDGPPAVRVPLLGVELQGLLRSRDAAGRVIPHPEPWAQCERFVAAGAHVFLSEEDTGDAVALARRAAAAGATVLLTRGYRGASLFAGGQERELEAIAANPTDPTGAGDCFATAFLVRVAETADLDEACQFALAAGALAVEGPGLAGIPTRAMVEARLRREAA
ncbi:MAG: hypothetical protein HYX53_15395 [Chloroflexi bacterium]|nr:hypothetical protein [Chloroflexota bacterium]